MDNAFEETAVPDVVPGICLRNLVVFPLDVISVPLDRPRSIRMVEANPGDGVIVGCFFPREPDESAGDSTEDYLPIGIACRVIHRMKMPNDTLQVVLQGLKRIHLDEIVQAQPYLQFRVSAGDGREPRGADVDGSIYRCMEMVDQLVKAEGGYPPEMVNILRMNIAGAGRFADLVGAHVNFDAATKRRIASTRDIRERLHVLEEVLEGALARLQVETELQSKVRVDIEDRQREHLLRAQLKAIRKELGIEGDAEADVLELRERIDDSGMSSGAEDAATREVDRLASMPPASAEYHVVRTYVGWLLDLPWVVEKRRKVNLKRAQKILDRDHFGLDDVKTRILEFLAVRRLTKDVATSQVLCLAGPPGVGKTSLGRSVAEAMNRSFVRISVGGMRDEAEVMGHRRTYVGAMPGKIIQEIKRAGTADPVFVIDEIDKMGSDARGDPSSAMLEVLDPEQNNAFLDHYLDVPFDLSRVFFLCTANVLENIPGPLRDRMEVVRLSGYTNLEKFEIARRHIVPKVLKANGLTGNQVQFTDEGLRAIVEGYTREAGVRELQRQIGRICRQRALDVALGTTDKKRLRVDVEAVERVLGPRSHEPLLRSKTAQVGVASGLAWTPVGGDLLFFEAVLVPGRGRLKVTGRLGDVMRESSETALSFVRSIAHELEIDAQRFEEHDIHLHVPDGATPKDGPSAGVTIAACLASLLSARPIRPEVAMTGEITLKGRVLAVGGVKSKVLAAHRAGIRQVLLPAANKKDLRRIPEEIRDALDIRFTESAVENIQTVLMPIFLPEPNQEGLEALPPPLEGGLPPSAAR